MGIYSEMRKNWEVYCFMSAIAYIEEMSKPTINIQIKKYKNKIYKCLCFHSIRLKMKDKEVINKLFDITKHWQEKKKIQLLGKNTSAPSKENWSGQNQFYLSPMWINHILKTCGKIPNKYSLETANKRLNHLKQYKKIPIDISKNNLLKMLANKKLTAGAFIISMDLEFRGIQSGKPSLCMSEKYKDFLEFMLTMAQKWGWTHNKKLSKVCINHSLKRGIKATPQYEFRININGLKEIYSLAGPLINSHKNKCIKFHVKRSSNYTNKGHNNGLNNSKEKILKYIKKNPNATTTHLQFITNTGGDVVLMHLNHLEKKGKLIKQRNGKRYIWNIKNDN